jgi:hypothetical protein
MLPSPCTPRFDGCPSLRPLPPLTPLDVAQGRWRDGTGARSYSREVRTRQAGPRKGEEKIGFTARELRRRLFRSRACARISSVSVERKELTLRSHPTAAREGAREEWQRGPTPQRIRTRCARGESQVERLERGSHTPVTSASRGDDGPPVVAGPNRPLPNLLSFLFFFIFFYLISFPISNFHLNMHIQKKFCMNYNYIFIFIHLLFDYFNSLN